MKERSDLLACPVCTGNVRTSRWPRVYVAPFNAQQYSLHRCGSCELSFWTPLEIVPAFYEDEGFGAYADYHEGRRPFPPWCMDFFEKMPITEGSLLDVGCGDGAFLSRAKSAGFESSGIEMDKSSVVAATAVYGLTNITRSSLEEFVGQCMNDAITFDVISFFEVLEHQDRPADFIEQVMSILRPGGYIAGSVPNAQRFLATIDRMTNSGDLPPHHFLWFSKKTLNLFLSRKQFVSILIHPSGNISFKELRDKVAALLYRKMAVEDPSFLMQVLLFPATLCAAFFLWTGYLVSPAHLYFQASKPTRSAKNDLESQVSRARV